MTSPKPFAFEIEADEITDLRTRLDRTRWPAQIPGVCDYSRGVPVDQARRFATYWRDLNWFRAEEEINRLDQFTIGIDGQKIHFVHERSSRPDAVPLLLLHGWPGSVVEFLDLVPALTEPADPAALAFHVVAPSHPGTGLSEVTTTCGWGVARTACACIELMGRLGYRNYFVQGGDHGAIVGPHVARLAPNTVQGVHVNAATVGFMPRESLDEADTADLSPLECRRLAAIERFMTEENGYNVIQATRPQTIGYGLEDSPIALLTWMLDKFHAWTGDPAILDVPRFRFLMLVNISAYWFRRTATSAANNIYAEYRNLLADPAAFEPSGVPTGVLALRGDPSIRRFAEKANNVVHWSDKAAGGHFAAMEAPDVLAADLRKFVAGVVRNRVPVGSTR